MNAVQQGLVVVGSMALGAAGAVLAAAYVINEFAKNDYRQAVENPEWDVDPAKTYLAEVAFRADREMRRLDKKWPGNVRVVPPLPRPHEN